MWGKRLLRVDKKRKNNRERCFCRVIHSMMGAIVYVDEIYPRIFGTHTISTFSFGKQLTHFTQGLLQVFAEPLGTLENFKLIFNIFLNFHILLNFLKKNI